MIVRREAKGLERIVVHLELDLMMRRIEVLRSELHHFESGRSGIVRIKGKGRHGGKERSISWHPDTADVLDFARAKRDELIRRAKAKVPSLRVPDALLMYECVGGLRPYQKSALDGILRGLSARTGFHFSHHTLRRTGARMLYFSLVKEEPGHALEKVQYVLGHSDPRTTELYLGLKADDVAHAMVLYSEYQKAVKIPEKGISDTSQQESGPCGIRDHDSDWLVVENSNLRNHLPRSAVEK
jgi:integrase